jgi:hypothetical protein
VSVKYQNALARKDCRLQLTADAKMDDFEYDEVNISRRIFRKKSLKKLDTNLFLNAFYS